jgi:predicted tellurium resistance membrane protein TerC
MLEGSSALLALLSFQNLLTLLTLTGLEIVLGIDNIVVLAIITNRLEKKQRPRARKIGLGLAMLMRIALLLSLIWAVSLTKPLFYLFGAGISGKGVVLIAGGIFLIIKSTYYIYEKFRDAAEGKKRKHHKPGSFTSAIIQIVVLDLVFSLDSVITAVGLSQIVAIMVTAIVIAVLIMMLFAGPVGDFVEKYPTLEVLALTFLIVVGVVLTSEGFGYPIDHGYIYTALGFALVVEVINNKLFSSNRRTLRPETAKELAGAPAATLSGAPTEIPK